MANETLTIFLYIFAFISVSIFLAFIFSLAEKTFFAKSTLKRIMYAVSLFVVIATLATNFFMYRFYLMRNSITSSTNADIMLSSVIILAIIIPIGVFFYNSRKPVKSIVAPVKEEPKREANDGGRRRRRR